MLNENVITSWMPTIHHIVACQPGGSPSAVGAAWFALAAVSWSSIVGVHSTPVIRQLSTDLPPCKAADPVIPTACNRVRSFVHAGPSYASGSAHCVIMSFGDALRFD
ncbi:MAG: hypothetical protein ACREFV_04270 [Acetobacteraceae bacterium]